MMFPISLEDDVSETCNVSTHESNTNKTNVRMHVVRVNTCPIERLYKRFAAPITTAKKGVPFDPSEPECIVIGFKKGPWSYNFEEDE